MTDENATTNSVIKDYIHRRGQQNGKYSVIQLRCYKELHTDSKNVLYSQYFTFDFA